MTIRMKWTTQSVRASAIVAVIFLSLVGPAERITGAEPADKDQNLMEKWRTPQPINFEENKLDSILGYFNNLTGNEIEVRWKALGEAGIKRSSPITLQLRGVSLYRAMQLVLDQVGGKRGVIGRAFGQSLRGLSLFLYQVEQRYLNL